MNKQLINILLGILFGTVLIYTFNVYVQNVFSGNDEIIENTIEENIIIENMGVCGDTISGNVINNNNVNLKNFKIIYTFYDENMNIVDEVTIYFSIFKAHENSHFKGYLVEKDYNTYEYEITYNNEI